MALELSLIEKLCKDAYRGRSDSAELFQHPNYRIVTDYLTGKAATLQGLAPAQENYAFVNLVDLLEAPGQPAANDVLLLDVIWHPEIFKFANDYFFKKLVQHHIEQDTSSFLQAAYGYFKKAGYNTDKIFETYMVGMFAYPGSQALFEREDSSLKQFLLSIMPPTILQTRYFYSEKWNDYYFQLLEEGKPHLLEEYILFGIIYDMNKTLHSLIHHKQGKYIPLVTGWIRKSTADYNLQKRFETALRLYDYNAGEYRSLATGIAQAYLDHFMRQGNKDLWESWASIKDFIAKSSYGLRYSGAALHFMMEDDKDRGKELVYEWFQNKVFVSLSMLEVLQYHLGDDALPYLKLGLQADASVGGVEYYTHIINLLAENFQPGQYLDTLWTLVTNKSKTLRETVARIVIERDVEAESKAVRLLAHKNAEARQTGAVILSHFSSESALSAVMSLLDTETNDNTRDIFLQIMATHLPRQADESFVGRMVAAAQQRGKLAKPEEPWLAEEDLPSVYFTSGRQLTVEEVRFLLYRMSRVKGMRSDVEARYLLDLLDREKAASFAKAVIRLYMDKGARPEYKYLLALAALLGNDEVVDKLRTVTNGFIDDNRVKMAEHGVGALALQGSDKALRWVEWYSRKYKNKKANVGAAALQALQDAAEELGITTHELGDRIVPDFGFEGLFKEFTINGEEYRAFIDSNFKICFFNEDNKKLKSLPASAGAELKEEFKQIGKEVRDVVRSQSDRLEHYLVIQRRWTGEQWQQFYLNNPVMFIYATKLLWGTYDAQGRLTGTFACLEDTSLVNAEGEELELEEGSLVGIVHPLHLAEADLQAWKRQFFDLSIEPIFPQLDRPVFALKAGDGNKKIITDYAGKDAQPGSIRSTMEKKGWKKGDTGDGGSIDSYLLEDTSTGITAHLEVSGIFVGSFDADYDPKLGRLYFIDNRKPSASRWFNPPADEKDQRLLALKDLPPILYSEVRSAISAIKLKNIEAGTTV